MAKKKPSETRPKVNKAHGWYVGVFIAGCILPPIAVAMRFGFTRDFFINVLLTICGYFPSHFHNYLQNIRNNKNRGRTPQWAIQHGLIEPDKVQSLQWQNKYSERTNENIYENDETNSIHSGQSNRNSYKRSTGGGGGGGGGIERVRADRYAISNNKPKKELGARDLDVISPDDDDAHSIQSHSIRRHSFSSTRSQSNSAVNLDRAPTKKKSILGIFGGNKKKDRFEREREVRVVGDSGYGGGGASQEYGDDFEREINGVNSSRVDQQDEFGSSRAGGRKEPAAARVEDDGLHHTF